MPRDNTASKHIAVLAFPFATHAAPLLSLIRRLSAAAPVAKFSFFSTAQSNSMISNENERCEAIKHYNVADGTPENYVFSGNPGEPVENFIKATPGNFKTAMAEVLKDTGKGFSCIITDAFFWFAADMVAELHVPWVAVWTAGPLPVLLHIETDLIREKLGIEELGFNGLEGKTVDFFPGISAIPAIHLQPELTPKEIKEDMQKMLYKMGLMLPLATALVINAFEEMDTSVTKALKSRIEKVLNIGPLVLTLPDQVNSDSYNCLEWLTNQKQDSVVYISFGSVVTPPPHELAALAEALEAYDCPFIWSFRGNPDEKLPKGFLERTKEKGKVVPWAPQLQILQHSSTGAFITHSGWNSFLESVVAGVPMICRAFFGDQILNRWAIENIWEVGVGIEGGKISKDGTMKALQLVLSSQQGKNMRQRLDALKKNAFEAVRPHGSSTANFTTLVEIVTQ